MNLNENLIPQIEPRQLAEWLTSLPDLVVLDVREAEELRYAHIDHPFVIFLPLSKLANGDTQALAGIGQDRTVVVMCHVGVRSGMVASWLRYNGFLKVYNLTGGIDGYAREVDPSVGLY